MWYWLIHVEHVMKPNFAASWDEIGEENQVEETSPCLLLTAYLVSKQNKTKIYSILFSLLDAVKQLVLFLANPAVFHTHAACALNVLGFSSFLCSFTYYTSWSHETNRL